MKEMEPEGVTAPEVWLFDQKNECVVVKERKMTGRVRKQSINDVRRRQGRNNEDDGVLEGEKRKKKQERD